MDYKKMEEDCLQDMLIGQHGNFRLFSERTKKRRLG